MSELGASERRRLPDSAFAYIDSTGRRRLPIHDEAHVRNALARFDRVAFDDDEARDRARTRLLKAAKRYGIVPVGFIDGQLHPKQRLPTGQVTLFFADLEGSTRLLAELDDRYGQILKEVRRTVRAAVRKGGGHEVDARGDDVFAAFADPRAAVDAAVAVQRAMRRGTWPDGRDVRLRIGLHTGRPTLTALGYVGIAVNTAARICAAAHGGQILVSRAVRAAIGDGGVELRSLGAHRLRGIPDEQELFQAAAPDLETEFPPLRAAR